MKWYLEVLRKYAQFDGRAHRTEFWFFWLVNTAIGLPLTFLDVILGIDTNYAVVLGGIYNLAVLVPTLAVGARRLHDIGRSGWWQLLGLIPLVGLLILIVWWAKEGEQAPNRWGPNPWGAPQPI